MYLSLHFPFQNPRCFKYLRMCFLIFKLYNKKYKHLLQVEVHQSAFTTDSHFKK